MGYALKRSGKDLIESVRKYFRRGFEAERKVTGHITRRQLLSGIPYLYQKAVSRAGEEPKREEGLPITRRQLFSSIPYLCQGLVDRVREGYSK